MFVRITAYWLDHPKLLVTDRFQRVLNAAARVVTNTRKYDRGLHHTMRHELHWLDMSERIQFQIATTVYLCLHGRAPEYLSELFTPVNQRSSRYRLQSSQSNQLVVPPVKLSTYGPCSFAVAGPTTWNSLPEYLHDPELSIDSFRRQLKTFLFAQYWRRHSSALETFVPSRSINLFTQEYVLWNAVSVPLLQFAR